MKNLLIAGVAKSGKSTICEKICEEENIATFHLII